MIEVKNICKKFGSETVFKHFYVNFTEKFNLILGPSGSGKSTLLNLLATISSYDEGAITYFGQNLRDLDTNRMQDFRNDNLGIIFQENKLLENLTVVENIKINRSNISDSDIEEIADKLNIKHLLSCACSTLSGGEKQRVSIAKAVLSKPKIILADEPTGNLDGVSSVNVFKLFKQLAAERNVIIIMVSHDLSAAMYADEIFILSEGVVKSTISRDNPDKLSIIKKSMLED